MAAVTSCLNKNCLKLFSLHDTAVAHRASSIKVSETAKVIKNTQRDLNFSLMNERALIFDRLGIGRLEVKKTAFICA